MNNESGITPLEAAIVAIAFIMVFAVVAYVMPGGSFTQQVSEPKPQQECPYDCGYKQIWINSVNPGSFGEDITVYDREFTKYSCRFNVCLNAPQFKCYEAFVFRDLEGALRIADLVPVDMELGDHPTSGQCADALKARGWDV